LKEDIAANAGMSQKIALLFGKMDREINAIGGNIGASEPAGRNPTLLTLSIDLHAHG
jgi:hypothetical protein